ncbi:DNA alkylation repair protein [Arthrobacter sp. NPDC089319]|uniref:DNA alkylation repair protein n=1 Tax=Arthrobacter sp. NPDC089319 TaxID=3155915 RepID=UPI00343D581B
MSEAAEFIDFTLQREASEERARAAKGSADGLRYYGASIGAVRGTVRDAGRKFRPLSHDQVTSLSSELWKRPVFELRLAAVVLLQSHQRLLRNSDLTRIEGFLRDARTAALVDPLAVDVVGPLIHGLTDGSRARAESILDRWAREPDPWLRRAAILAPLRAVRSAGMGADAVLRRTRAAAEQDDNDLVREALALLCAEWAKDHPGRIPSR